VATPAAATRRAKDDLVSYKGATFRPSNILGPHDCGKWLGSIREPTMGTDSMLEASPDALQPRRGKLPPSPRFNLGELVYHDSLAQG
jgi:hypothetical protein